MLFLPATPDAELASRIRGVVEEEGRRLGLAARVVERGGTSLRQQLVKTDLGYILGKVEILPIRGLHNIAISLRRETGQMRLPTTCTSTTETGRVTRKCSGLK